MANLVNEQTNKPRFTLWLMAALGLWLLALLALASWYQANYIRPFTQQTPQLVQADYTDNWLSQLDALLPKQTASQRIVQFWQPNCLCNRFARPHALSTVQLAMSSENIEHITLIPARFQGQVHELQQLNPNTRILTLASAALDIWPNSPSVILQGEQGQLSYFGPLGFGAFCSQASTPMVQQQAQNPEASPFYNVIGSGCFCPWG